MGRSSYLIEISLLLHRDGFQYNLFPLSVLDNLLPVVSLPDLPILCVKSIRKLHLQVLIIHKFQQQDDSSESVKHEVLYIAIL